MGKIQIFINIFMNYYYYYYLLKFIYNLLYDTYDMIIIWYVHMWLRTLTLKLTGSNFQIIVLNVQLNECLDITVNI